MVQLEVLVSLIAGCAVLATCLTTCLISVDLATPLTLTVAEVLKCYQIALCLQPCARVHAPVRLACFGACEVTACSLLDLSVSWLPVIYACRAPEQVDAEFGDSGTHTDVWGFAACMLHLATGQLPYQGLTQMQMVSAMFKKHAPEVPDSLPDWLQQILEHALTFNTAARPSVALLHKVHQSLCRCNVMKADASVRQCIPASR